MYKYILHFFVFYCICSKVSVGVFISQIFCVNYLIQVTEPSPTQSYRYQTFRCFVGYSWRHESVPFLLSKQKKKAWRVWVCDQHLILSAATALAFALVSLSPPLVAPCFSLAVLWLIHNEVSQGLLYRVQEKLHSGKFINVGLIMDCRLWWVFL